MGTRNIRKTLKEARAKAGLSQSEMAEGICTLQAFSRIETGVSCATPGTFRALMARVGAPCECFPVFAGRDDFECFYTLKQARFFTDAWQLDAAFEALGIAEKYQWAGNRLYYQEWLFLHCRLQFRSYCCDHSYNHARLLEALHVTRPDIDLADFHKLLLTRNEIQILTSIAQELLYIGRCRDSLRLCTDIRSYLDSSAFTALAQKRMLGELAIVHVKCLISIKEYVSALEMADTHRHRMAVDTDSSVLELTFLTGLCGLYLNSPNAAAHIRAAFYSAHAIDSRYAAVCLDYLLRETDFPASEYMRGLPAVPLRGYPASQRADISKFGSGIYSKNDKNTLPLGKLIKMLRTEQKISQAVLCYGLCSISKLSKIESETLQPDLALTEVLLQRLGMSERMFSFVGNERDAQFYELKFKIIHTKPSQKETIETYVNEMKKLIKAGDRIYCQVYLFEKAMLRIAPEERIAGLTEALLITLPDFDIHKLLRWRLSWAELSILNNIAHEYRRTDKAHLSTLYFEQILAYINTAAPDSLLLASILPYTYYMYCHSLYAQKLFENILSFHQHINLPLLKSNVFAYGSYLFFYSQALGECGQPEAARLAATQACSIEHMAESFKNAWALKKGIYHDFSIEADY